MCFSIIGINEYNFWYCGKSFILLSIYVKRSTINTISPEIPEFRDWQESHIWCNTISQTRAEPRSAQVSWNRYQRRVPAAKYRDNLLPDCQPRHEFAIPLATMSCKPRYIILDRKCVSSFLGAWPKCLSSPRRKMSGNRDSYAILYSRKSKRNSVRSKTILLDGQNFL